jgi:RimJ/RimL family protein N-acetyltransferase
MVIGSKVILRDKRLTDARNDYAWQTDPELAWLDAAPLLTITLPQYLSDYAAELCYSLGVRQRFAVETLEGKHIGNCSYYDIDEVKGEAELGIMIGDRAYWDKGYGADAIVTLLNHIFRHTSFKRIYLKTLTCNSRAQECFKKCGFVPYGRLIKDGFNFVLMDISREQWEKQRR